MAHLSLALTHDVTASDIFIAFSDAWFGYRGYRFVSTSKSHLYNSFKLYNRIFCVLSIEVNLYNAHNPTLYVPLDDCTFALIFSRLLAAFIGKNPIFKFQWQPVLEHHLITMGGYG